MTRVILGMTMSVDGYINDRDGDLAPLYPDLPALRKTNMLREAIRNTGAAVMGRHTYDYGKGDFTNYEFQVPIFVLTHHVPEKPPRGENKKLRISFITDGIERVIELAKKAAGSKDVTIIGGADIARQVLEKGLADELHVGIVPLLLGEGRRWFDHSSSSAMRLEKISTTEELGVTYLTYRVIKKEFPELI